MPTFGQSAFLGRAIGSLMDSTCPDWELVIVDDASTDATPEAIAPWLDDPRIRSVRLPANVGVGAALNIALDLAGAPAVAYLPSDDLYLPTTSPRCWQSSTGISAAVGLSHSFERSHRPDRGPAPPEHDDLRGPQLVQVAHRVTGDRSSEPSS